DRRGGQTRHRHRQPAGGGRPPALGCALPAEPRWLSVEAVAAINRDIVEESDEPHLVRDYAALNSAVAHPWNVWVYFMDQDIAVLAARLYTSLLGGRAFEAGNKRTALAAAAAFVEATATNWP